MSAVYSRQLAIYQGSPGGTITLATVPTGVVWVIRSITLANGTTTATGFVSLFASAGTTNTAIALSSALQPQDAVFWNGRHVLNAGNRIRLYNAADEVQVLVSGYELSAP